MGAANLGVLLLAGLALAGCGESRKPRSADETVFKDQVQALERARSVEEEAEKRKQELDRRIAADEEGGR
jgi:hypothetical protein